MVRNLQTGRFKLRLCHASAMPGSGVGSWGRMPTQSIPRDGLRDLRRELEHPRLAQALSAPLLGRFAASRLQFGKTTAANVFKCKPVSVACEPNLSPRLARASENRGAPQR